MLLFGFLISAFIHLTPALAKIPIAFDRAAVEPAVRRVFDREQNRKANCSNINPNKVFLLLYTSRNNKEPIVFSEDKNNNYALFRKDLETKVLIHGWQANPHLPLFLEMKEKYLQKGDYNMIFPDWSTYSAKESDSVCICLLPRLAKAIGRLIYDMVKRAGLDLQKTHLIGLSLGGQLAGLVGQEIQNLMGKKVARISGLDAVGPGFCTPTLLDPDQRLSPDDADFVDAIHTDGTLSGCSVPYGHADFYVNCGKYQPGCKATDLDIFGLYDNPVAFILDAFIHPTPVLPTLPTSLSRADVEQGINMWYDKNFRNSSCQEVNPRNIFFHLYTDTNRKQPIAFSEDNNNDYRLFEKNLETKIVLHGWMTLPNNSVLIMIKDKYFQRGNYNVIISDWSTYSVTESSVVSVCFVPKVAKIMGLLIYNMVKKAGLDLQKTHLIGLSLGGQLAGFIGQEIQKLTGKKVARISGVDVLGPGFCTPTLVHPDLRLSSDDADFVDALHTDGAGLGCPDPYGDADFYINCGKYQIGCKAIDLSVFYSYNNTAYYVETVGCSHRRAFELWIEGILSDGFVAKKCSSCFEFVLSDCDQNEKVIMGENCPSNVTGSFYLRTNSHAPYAIGN